jgi:sugar phosphate isomerase/epimerase
MSEILIHAFADEASPMIAGQIAAMQRNGLQGVEMRGVDGANVSDIPVAKAREVRQQLADAGLTVWAVGSPIGKIPVDGDHAAHREKLRHTLEVARALGTRRIRMFSYYMPQGSDPEDWRQAVIDRLGELLEDAKAADIWLCHENEKGIYGDVAPRCLTLLEALPELKSVFDPANFVQCGQDTMEAWKLLGSRTDYLHIKDALADGTVVPAGCGTGHLLPIVHAWLEQGGRAMTVEPHLRVFDGLSALERPGEGSVIGGKFTYPTADAAFDAACGALREMVNTCEHAKRTARAQVQALKDLLGFGE